VLAGVGVSAAVLAGFLWRDTLVVVGLWLLLAGLVRASREGRAPLLAWVPGLTWLGTVSYAYYMSFAPVEMVEPAVYRRLGVAPADLRLLYGIVTTGLTLLLATAAWLLVERSAMAWGSLPRVSRIGRADRTVRLAENKGPST
jgi:peptidoglycan/LPS O-acetylase OafA/YrhL